MPAREIRQGQSLITPDEVNFWLATGQRDLKALMQSRRVPPGSRSPSSRSSGPLEMRRLNASHAAAAPPHEVNIHGGRIWAKAVTLN